MKYTVGVSEMHISCSSEDLIVTHALGSCIGIAIYDPHAVVGGILHYMLPQSKVDKEKADKKPCMFGDTGIPLLFGEAYKCGATKKNLRIIMAGGAQVFAHKDYFDIGKRNAVIARKMFWKNNYMIDAEDVGGHKPRTLYLDMESGDVWITSHGQRKDL